LGKFLNLSVPPYPVCEMTCQSPPHQVTGEGMKLRVFTVAGTQKGPLEFIKPWCAFGTVVGQRTQRQLCRSPCPKSPRSPSSVGRRRCSQPGALRWMVQAGKKTGGVTKRPFQSEDELGSLVPLTFLSQKISNTQEGVT
jgi:hypothetical protein